MSRKLTAELAHLPVLVVATAGSKPQYAHGVYLSGIGRLIARTIETGEKVTIRSVTELVNYVFERGQVGALAKLADLCNEALIAESAASRKTRPLWLASLAMIRQAIATLSEQPVAVREVA